MKNKELQLQKEIEKLTKELEAVWPLADKRLLDLRAEIDSIKLEIVSLKKILKDEIPSFEKRFSKIFKDTLKQVPPE